MNFSADREDFSSVTLKAGSSLVLQKVPASAESHPFFDPSSYFTGHKIAALIFAKVSDFAKAHGAWGRRFETCTAHHFWNHEVFLTSATMTLRQSSYLR